ncbi:hypothetical protein [Micromonospora sp. NPDC092111]|uniref:hypothetical protein n=1 Tax=Micromonospora sp. NPDC092111 TaxID=3364289 RepID=UPI003822AC4D
MKVLTPAAFGRAILWACAAAAAAAAISSISVVLEADGPTKLVETWRGYGYAAFAALFAVLAHRPDTSLGVWAAVILNKIALTVTAVVYRSEASIAGTDTVIAWDGALSVLLIIAFVLTRGRAPRVAATR